MEKVPTFSTIAGIDLVTKISRTVSVTRVLTIAVVFGNEVSESEGGKP